MGRCRRGRRHPTTVETSASSAGCSASSTTGKLGRGLRRSHCLVCRELGDQQFRQEREPSDKFLGPGPLAQVSPQEELLVNRHPGRHRGHHAKPGIARSTPRRRAIAPAPADALLIKDGFEERLTIEIRPPVAVHVRSLRGRSCGSPAGQPTFSAFRDGMLLTRLMARSSLLRRVSASTPSCTAISGQVCPVEPALQEIQLVLGKSSEDGFRQVLVFDGFFRARSGVGLIGR